MKSSMTKGTYRGIIICDARFSRRKIGTGYVAIKNQNINT